MTTEAQTRVERIDHQLARAGWATGSRMVLTEHLLSGRNDILARDEAALTQQYGNEIPDYVLLDAHERPMAIIEAKRTSRDPLEGERQAADYADRIRAIYGVDPFIFLANGTEICFWHRRLYPPRRVSGFFTQEDLDRLAYLDRACKPLDGLRVDERIVDRGYQIEAVKTVCDRVALAKRRFLMVLATGTGKTRVAIALVEALRRHKWIQRVLFLADRRELVKQAIDAFREFLPDAPRCWIEAGEMDRDARVHVATYPGMMGLYQRISPGHYDLVISDESHRSIYNRYRAILDHFDALHLGLTATPTDFIDHNTFHLFDCPDETPTFYYGYDEAVRDRHLVPYRPVHAASTVFQIEGLKPGELPVEAAEAVRQQGVDPDDFSFEGTELERRVTNTGTNDAIVREFMAHAIRDNVGMYPAKTIIFAVSHRHALDLYRAFNRLHPDIQARGFAKIIDSRMERAEETLADFKNKDYPRVAISVDMLDTGIDVPPIRNLVFAKPVFSKVKFWQMIGRGTRRWTDPVSGDEKQDFLIIDHWNNFDYFQVNKDGRAGSVSEPLPTRLFRLRLEKLQILMGRGGARHAADTLASLQVMFGGLPMENVNVAPHAEELRNLATSTDAWQPLDETRVRHLALALAPLLRFGTPAPWPEMHFEHLTEQLALAHLRADAAEVDRLKTAITNNLRLLPRDLPEVRPHLELLTWILTPAFWEHLEYDRIMQLQSVFSPLMRFRARSETGQVIRISLPDTIAQRRWIVFGPGGEGSFAENYRAQVEAMVLRLAGENPALEKLRQGSVLSDEELDALARLIGGPDLFVCEERLRQAYDQPQAGLCDFLRHILGIARLPSREERISRAFDAWIREHPTLSATQLMFVRTLRQAVLRRAEVVTVEALHQPPFTGIGDPEQLFVPGELADILKLVQELAA